MQLPISIVIPTLNEEFTLPKLLRSIQNQTMPPKEVIVADGYSKDHTREIAQSFGARIVPGGLPGKGRNQGAKVATQRIILFLDADVILPPKFIEKTYFEMTERNLDIASCFITPRSRNKKDRAIAALWNSCFTLLETISPSACGFCIFVRKDIYEKTKGFDETILIGEDVDFVRRAAKYGKFRFLDHQKIPISFRRFVEEGRFKMVMNYLAITLHTVFVGKVRKDIFKYKFGEHRKA